MLENFEGVQKAYSLAMDSAGSATQENARYMESLEAKTANLKASFTDLVLGEGGIHDLIAFSLDAGTALLDGLQNPVVQTTIEIIALTAAMNNLNKVLGAGLATKFLGTIKGLPQALGAFVSSGGLAVGIVAALAVSFMKLHKATMDYKSDIESFTPEYQSFDTLQQKIEDTNESLEYSETEFENNKTKVAEYTDILMQLGYTTDRTKEENTKLNEAIENLNKIFPSLNLAIDATTGQLNKEQSFVQGLSQAYIDLAKNKLIAARIEATEMAIADIELSQEAISKQQAITEKHAKSAAEKAGYAGSSSSFWDRVTAGTLAVTGRAESTFVSDYKYGVTSALKSREATKLSKEHDRLTKELDELRKKEAEITKGLNETSDEYKKAFASVASIGSEDYDSDGAGASSIGGSGAKKTKDALKELKSSFDDIIAVMEHKISIDKKAGASIDEQIKSYQQLQAETHRQAETYRQMGLSDTHEYVRKLQNLWWQYYDTIQDLQKQAYENEVSYQKDLISALGFYSSEQQSSIDKQIDALNQELQALENQNDEREKALELTKAQQALEDARKQKIRVYQKGQGWTWVSDPRKVAEAEEELESIQRDRALEDEKQAIQDRIDAYEKQKQAWADVVSDYGKYQNRLELEMQLGTTIEKAIFGDRTKNIENFKDAYIKAINSMITAQQKLNEMNDVKTTLPSESMVGGTGGSIAGATTTGGGGGGGVNKYSSSDDRSVMEAKMKANSKAWHTADSATRKKLESENQKIGKALGMKYTSSTGKWAYASGTTGMPSTQLALVGERGAELGIFPRGTGIVPHNLTENLMEIGKYSMNQLKTILGRPSGTIDKSSHISINEVRVNSNNADNFVRQLQNMVFNQK